MDLILTVVFLFMPLFPPLAIFGIVRYGPFPNRWWRGENAIGFALLVGSVALSAGLIGPMVLVPRSNIAPILGFVTGPLGALVGLVWGLIRAHARKASRANS